MCAITDKEIGITDPTHTAVEAVKKSFAELDGYPVTDLTGDIEMAELIGRFKSLVGVLIAVVDGLPLPATKENGT